VETITGREGEVCGKKGRGGKRGKKSGLAHSACDLFPVPSLYVTLILSRMTRDPRYIFATETDQGKKGKRGRKRGRSNRDDLSLVHSPSPALFFLRWCCLIVGAPISNRRKSGEKKGKKGRKRRETDIGWNGHTRSSPNLRYHRRIRCDDRRVLGGGGEETPNRGAARTVLWPRRTSIVLTSPSVWRVPNELRRDDNRRAGLRVGGKKKIKKKGKGK